MRNGARLVLEATRGTDGCFLVSYKTFFILSSTEQKFKMLINIEIAKIDGIFRFNSLEPAIYPANKC